MDDEIWNPGDIAWHFEALLYGVNWDVEYSGPFKTKEDAEYCAQDWIDHLSQKERESADFSVYAMEVIKVDEEDGLPSVSCSTSKSVGAMA